MPVIRTDDDGSGYRVAPVEVPTGPDGDFRLLDLGEIYERVMLEDDESIRAAGDGWGAVGQRFLDLAADLRRRMDSLADSWHADSATALAERVDAAAVSLETWGAMAASRHSELHDLGQYVRNLKTVLAGIWRDFVAETGSILTPPADLTLEQRQQWRAEAADAPALEVAMRTHTDRALVQVVNPLASRYAEVALAFAAPGPRYGGPTNATRPSDRSLFALFSGTWPPELPAFPEAPGALPAPRTPQVPPAPGMSAPAMAAPPLPPAAALAAALAVVAPLALGLPPDAVRSSAPVAPRLPGLTALPPASEDVVAALAGRRLPPVHAPTAPTPVRPGPVVQPLTAPTAPGVPTGALPPSLPGRAGLAPGSGATVSAPGVTSPGAPSAGAPTVLGARGSASLGSSAPHLPPLPGAPGAASPASRLPGRTGAPGASGTRLSGPAPSLPGSTLSRSRSAGSTPHGSGLPGTPSPGTPSPGATAPRATPPRSRAPGNEPLRTTLPGSVRHRGEPSDEPGPPIRGESRHALRTGMPTGPHLLGRTAPEMPAQPTPPPSLGSPRPLTGPTGQPRRRDRAGFIDHRADVTGGQLDEVHPALRTGRPAPTDPVPQLRSRHGTGPAESPRGELQGSTLGTRPGQAARRATATDATGSGELGRQASPDATPSRAQQRVADRTRRRAEWEEQRRDQRAASSNGW